jgi:hypothetical protein
VFAHQDSGILSLQPESSFDQETIVDLTHESVMAKWRMLASWIDEEDRDYGLFRDALVDAKRCREGEDTLWRGVRVNEAVKWADQPHHNAAWAERYVGRPHEAPKSVKAVRDFIRRSVRLQEREDGLLRRKRRNASIAFALACGLLVLAIVFLVDRSRKNEQLNAQSKKLGATVVTLSKKEGELQDAIARQKMTLADLGLAKETAEENLQRAKENATRRAEAERELEHLLEKQFSTNRRLERTQAQLEQQVKDLDTAKKEINGLLDKSTEQFKKLQEEQKESNRLRAESEQLRRESDRGAALSRALAGNTNLARGEALLSLNDAIVSLELGIRAEWVPPETVQLTRRALQAVNTLALFRPANTEIADIAVISDGRLRALSNNGRLRQGALGCSVGSNRYNGLPIVYLGRFASSRLAEAYLKKPSAQALDSGGGVLLGFADGSARWLLADSRSSTQEPDPARDAGGDISFEDIKDWRPHKGKIALIAASRDLGGVLTATAGDEPAVMISRSQGRQRSLLSLINILRRPQKAAELISEPTGLAMTRDGAEIALIQREGSLLWGSAVGGKWALKPLLYKDPSAVAIAGRPDEPQIAVGTKAGVVWTGTNPNSLNMVRPLGEPVSALAWNESGTLLAVGGEKGALEIFDSGRPRQVAGHSGAVKRLVWASVADQDVLISSDVTSIRLTNAREVPGVRELASRLPRAGPINAKAQEEARKVAEGLKEVLRIRLDQDANCLPAHLKSLRQSLTAKTP